MSNAPAAAPHFTTPRATGSARINVGTTERLASAFGGAALAVYGVTRGSIAGALATGLGAALLWRGTTGHCPVFEQAGLNTAEAGKQTPRAIEISESVTVNAPRDKAYGFWRRLENLPRFMHHIRSVTEMGENRSLWTAKGPGALPDIEWEAEIVEDQPGTLLVWRSLPDADVDNAGHVRFLDAPHGGTEIHARIAYRAPAGSIGRTLAKWLDPVLSQMVKEDIRRFKRILETGEVPTIEGQPKGS